MREGEAWHVTGAGPERVGLAREGQEGGFRPAGNAAGNVSVYETRPISLMAGDEIVFTRNLKRRTIINGERARIEAIGSKRVRIRLESGRGLSFGVDDDDLGHIDHAWSSTVHRAQGLTKGDVIAVLDANSMMSDRAMLYVEMSRARDGFVLLTDDTEQLAHRLAQEGEPPHSALEETGEESWLTPGPGETVADRGPLRPALDDWRALVAEAGQAGRPVQEMDGYGELMGRIRRRSQAEPELAAELRAGLEGHEAFTADRARVAAWAARIASASRERDRLLAEAQTAQTALQGLAGYAPWREDAEHVVAEGREILTGGGRWRQHMDGTGQIEERMEALARAHRTDERAGALLAALAGGGMDDALAAGIADAASEAQPGEMPPELTAARADWLAHQRQERLAEDYLARLGALAAERQELRAGLDGPVAAHADYAGWRQRLEDALGQV